MENVIILGTGAAGLTAAIYTARASLKPLVIEGLQPGGQLTTTTEVENFPGFPEGVDGTLLMTRMREQAERFGTRTLFATITGADLGGDVKKVIADDGTVLEARTVIVATGASAKYVGLPNEQKLIGRGVTSCATCDGAFYKNVPVAVVGGGDTAMEEANFLTRFASTVYLIHRRGEFRAGEAEQWPRVPAGPEATHRRHARDGAQPATPQPLQQHALELVVRMMGRQQHLTVG